MERWTPGICAAGERSPTYQSIAVLVAAARGLTLRPLPSTGARTTSARPHSHREPKRAASGVSGTRVCRRGHVDRRRHRLPTASVIALLAALALAGAGCSGAPDASGQWGGNLTYIEVDDTEQHAGLSFDLSQDSDNSLSGTMSLEAEEEAGSVPISSGEVGEDGSVQIQIESQNPLDPEPLTFDGEINGDRLDGEVFGFSEEGATFSVERGAEQDSSRGGGNSAGGSENGGETVLSSDDAGDYAAESTGATAEEARAAVRRFSDLDSETSGAVESLETRISTLEDPHTDLEEALGPDSRDPDIFDCASDPASCEAAAIEDRLEQDRATFEEEGYNQQGCKSAHGPDYYAGYENFDATGGETYLTERNRIEEAADGLTGEARAVLSMTRDTEEAYNEARRKTEEANTTLGSLSPSYRPSEVEPLIEAASDAQERADEALPAANQRYDEGKSRAEAAISEAKALYARAGCAIDEA